MSEAMNKAYDALNLTANTMKGIDEILMALFESPNHLEHSLPIVADAAYKGATRLEDAAEKLKEVL